MIAAGDHVGAGIDDLVIDRLRDAEAAGRVLAVDGDEIELPVAISPGSRSCTSCARCARRCRQ
jgi:hypothetical protein